MTSAEVVAFDAPNETATDDARDLRGELAALMRADAKLTQAEISRQSGIGGTRLNQWLKGSYPGDAARLESEIERFIDAYRERQLAARMLPHAPAFVPTPSAERVLSALSYAQIAGDMTVVYGGAGLGKTQAVREYQRSAPNVWHATMTPATATVVPALETIADALGLRELGTGAGKIQRAVISRMIGSQGLLVIDEAQHLGVAALDEVRALHDATDIGVALVGNEAVYARMTGGNRAPYLDRLYSRIGKRVRLTRTTAKDVDAIIAAWQVDAKPCRKLLHEIAAKPGGLRGLTKTLRLATMFARGKAVDCDAIKRAWRDLGGE